MEHEIKHETKHRILFIDGVAKKAGMSVYWVRREIAKGTLPKSISNYRCKGRWLESDIDRWLESLSKVNDAAPVPAKNEKQGAKEFDDRQEQASKVLERHSRNRKQR